MASEVRSGASNASYTNNTGQNVRLIINYMRNVTSMTWAGVNVTASATTIGKDIQNITGELRQVRRGQLLSTSNTADSTVWTAELVPGPARIRREFITNAPLQNSLLPASPTANANDFDPTAIENEKFITTQFLNDAGSSGVSSPTSLYLPNLFYVPLTISRGGDFPVELMLANGQAFSAVCGSFNLVAIREDGN